MTTKKLLHATLGCIALFLLSSCADTGYYGYGGSYNSGGYYAGNSFTSLPYGYSQIYVGSVPYYYHGNSWYRRSGGRYISCARPHGYHGSVGRHSSHSRYSHSPSYSSRSSNYRSSRSPSSYRSNLRTPQNYRNSGSRSPSSTRFNSGSRHGTSPTIQRTPRSGRTNATPRSAPRATPRTTPQTTPRITPPARGGRDGSRGRGTTTFVKSSGSTDGAARTGGGGRGEHDGHRRNR